MGTTAQMRLAAAPHPCFSIAELARARRTGNLLASPALFVHEIVEANMERARHPNSFLVPEHRRWRARRNAALTEFPELA